MLMRLYDRLQMLVWIDAFYYADGPPRASGHHPRRAGGDGS
jgi:hypothetical protein